MSETNRYIADTDLHPLVRTVLLLGSVFVLISISWITTGELLPTDEGDALLVQSSLLLIVLATLVSERFFTGPADAFLNSLAAMLTVLPQRSTAPKAPWWILMGFLGIVFVSALVCLLLQAGSSERVSKRWLVRVQVVCFQVSSSLGRARVVFSAVFLVAIAFFVQEPGSLSTALLVFWGIYIALWPLGIPQFFSRLVRRPKSQPSAIGHLSRVDSPNLARAIVSAGPRWTGEELPMIIYLPDGSPRWGLPLMAENRADGVLGTLLLGSEVSTPSLSPGLVALPSAENTLSRSEFVKQESEGRGSEILGLVREGSISTRLRFELLPNASVELGQLVVVGTSSGWIYHQVVEGETSEEMFGSLNYGSQIATAVPIGLLSNQGEFERARWLPRINSPVYAVDGEINVEQGDTVDFSLGHIPGTELELRGDFVDHLESHTAILGVTGSGKTELAFDLVRHVVHAGVKVICIDLTSQYAPRLNDLGPTQLSINETTANSLSSKLFDVETGEFRAGAEKKVLKEFADQLRSQVEERLKTFLQSEEEQIALIELREISNTKATLWLTEMYLSTLLKLAKEGDAPEKVLVVIEEAHTVMPEASFVGLGDFDSKGTIAKITQIALQGRKYGVGLLVLAQRTATVSKSVLTQCNTVVAFSCVDDTSINFLGNVFGSTVAQSLPNLPKLRAVAHGPWIRSQLPVTFEIPFDQAKAEMDGWANQSRVSEADQERTDEPKRQPSEEDSNGPG